MLLQNGRFGEHSAGVDKYHVSTPAFLRGVYDAENKSVRFLYELFAAGTRIMYFHGSPPCSARDYGMPLIVNQEESRY